MSVPCVEEIRAIRGRYLDKVRELERNRRIGDGLLGLKGGPEDDPCHDRFREDISGALRTFSGAAPASADVRAVLEELYAPPKKNEMPLSAYWMLIAVQGLTLELIERLDGGDASALESRYKADYRRWERLPVQRQILKSLEKQKKR